MTPSHVDYIVNPPDELGRIYVHGSDGWSGLVSDEFTAEQLIANHDRDLGITREVPATAPAPAWQTPQQ
jgi:hypothetical protein